MSGHDRYEELSALAATGDLSGEEFAELQEHLLECVLCRAAYRDFHALLHDGLPVVAPSPFPTWRDGGFSLKRRFRERAAAEGIRIDAPPRRLPRLLVAAAALAVAVCAGYSWRAATAPPIPRTIASRTEDAARIEALSQRVAELERNLADARVAVPAPAPAPPVNPAPSASEAGLTAEILRQRAMNEASRLESSRLEDTIGKLSARLEQLMGDLQTARGETETVRGTLRETQSALAVANRELDPLRLARSNDAHTIADQRLRIAELSDRVNEQSETLRLNRELLAIDKPIRDLIGARNVHVVDVSDEGTPGRSRSVPGRVFYTEGKNLIFYAYDLQNKANPAKSAFQVWGRKEGKAQPARSLGFLYQDDVAQKRWVLTYNDPAVLAQIDRVFVTVEKPGGSSQPTGKQLLLAAFMHDSPNHP